MSGRIDVANHENQLLLEKAKRKILEAQQSGDGRTSSPVKEFAGLPSTVKTVEGVLTRKEIDLLDYISSDFKKLLADGCKVRSTANISHLEHVMSLSEAMRCVEMGTQSFGGHIARRVKAPGPINGHHSIRPHERIHTAHVSTQEAKNLIAKPKILSHSKPFQPYIEPGTMGALSIIPMTQNLHDFDVDEKAESEKAIFENELDIFRAKLEAKKKENAKARKVEMKVLQALVEKRGHPSQSSISVDNSELGLRFPEFQALLDLPVNFESRDSQMNSSVSVERHYQDMLNKESERKDQKLRAAAKELSKKLEAEEEDEIAAQEQEQGSGEEEEEKISHNKMPRSGTELNEKGKSANGNSSPASPSPSPSKLTAVRKLRRTRKRLRLWRFFLTNLHSSCSQIEHKDIEDLAFLRNPSEIVSHVVYYICILLGVTPEWNAAKRILFKNISSFLSFLNAVNPLDLPPRRIQKATALRNESVLADLTADGVRRSCSTLPAVHALAVWVLNFDALAKFMLAMEDRKERLVDELDIVITDGREEAKAGAGAGAGSGAVTPTNRTSSRETPNNRANAAAASAGAGNSSPASKVGRVSEDHAAEVQRQQAILDRARRKYKHVGVKLMDPTVELRSLPYSPEKTSPIAPKRRVVIDYSKPRPQSSSAGAGEVSPLRPAPPSPVAQAATQSQAGCFKQEQEQQQEQQQEHSTRDAKRDQKASGGGGKRGGSAPVVDANFLSQNFGFSDKKTRLSEGMAPSPYPSHSPSADQPWTGSGPAAAAAAWESQLRSRKFKAMASASAALSDWGDEQPREREGEREREREGEEDTDARDGHARQKEEVDYADEFDNYADEFEGEGEGDGDATVTVTVTATAAPVSEKDAEAKAKMEAWLHEEEREREHELEIVREQERAIQRAEAQKQADALERERLQAERETREEAARLVERELERAREAEKEKQRRRDVELERERVWQRDLELAREIEKERLREVEKSRAKLREEAKDRDWEREREREREREKERDRERERDRAEARKTEERERAHKKELAKEVVSAFMGESHVLRAISSKFATSPIKVPNPAVGQEQGQEQEQGHGEVKGKSKGREVDDEYGFDEFED